MGNSPSTADIQDYRDGYPGKRDDPGATKNLQFYRLQIRTIPGRNMLTDFHTSCADGGRRGDYDWLEWDHSYIQWLFPIREQGLNWQAQELQLHEARAIAADPLLQGRIIDSYETMLDFYGMELVDRRTGAVRRQPPGRFEARYRNLNESYHNNLRITRILKCLGEVGLEHLKRPFVEHVLRECYQHRLLLRCRESCIDYWAQTLKDEGDRQQVKRWCRALHDEYGPALGLPRYMGEEEDDYAEEDAPGAPAAYRTQVQSEVSRRAAAAAEQRRSGSGGGGAYIPKNSEAHPTPDSIEAGDASRMCEAPAAAATPRGADSNGDAEMHSCGSPERSREPAPAEAAPRTGKEGSGEAPPSEASPHKGKESDAAAPQPEAEEPAGSPGASAEPAAAASA
eukprot:TRINITY_DN5525_c0_g2_i3.p1 TRINITY_DN5525_c0_g2~~TRINITY_DN5525_c0_g2_i3.p1  ORF type:complete len:429 (+),score=111.27 TRINITY_DN5525_c0_g2_i3:101-1288(+)